jgi:pyridoxal phosphate enzyme (YggS family)
MRRKLHDNLKRVEQRIADSCAKAGRDPKEVRLVAVTKYATPDVIRTLVDLGVTEIGESRAQELARRAAVIKEWISRRTASAGPNEEPRWHLVGHLQRNKVRHVLPWVHMIHSVDSLRLAEEIDAAAAKLDQRVPVLLEVNASGESSKGGVAVAATTHLAEQIASLRHLNLRGLMTMAPLTDDASILRHTFQRVREVFEEIVGERLCGAEFRELSMGMSNDFEYAIEFGATYVRIGSALFEGIELAPQPETVEQD